MLIEYPCNIRKNNLRIHIKGYDYINKIDKSEYINPLKIKDLVLTRQPSFISTGIFELNPNLNISIFNRGQPSHIIIPFNNLPKILKNEKLFNKLSKYKRKKLMWIFCKAVCSRRIKEIFELNRTRNNQIVKEALIEMRNLNHKLINAKTREELMGIEGNIAKIFYFCLCEFNKEFDSKFQRRDRNSRDIVNILMNFTHTILRNKIYYRLIINGINPYRSFFHNNNRNQVSLTFDFSEFWIAYIDKLIFYSLEKKIIKTQDITEKGLLKFNAKIKIIKLINKRILDKEIDDKIKAFIGYLKGENRFSWK